MRFAQVFSLSLLAASVTVHGQSRVNPRTQIQWPSCSAGQSYQPSTNTCGFGGSSSYPGVASDGANGLTMPGLNQGQLRDNGGEKFNLLAFGAVSDAKLSKVCSMTAGSAVLTCDDAPFVAGAVGMPISVELAGATLSGGVSGNLITTIAGYTDASHVTLANVAVNTTPTGLIDVDGVSLIGGTANVDLGPGTLNSVAGATVTGAIGQTCTLTTFNQGLGAATATVKLLVPNALSTLAPYQVTNGGGGGLGSPTTATLANGTATCSGTVTVTGSTDIGFGYYSGQWPTTTSGSGTGAVISIYGTMLGGGVNVNYQPPHWLTYQGSGYAVNDTLCPTVIGADGRGCFKVNKVNKAAAIWGTDNYTAFSNWLAACNGTKNCFIPAGSFLVTSAGNTHHIHFASNTTVTMDSAGVVYPIGMQPGFCTTAGWHVFGTVDGTQAAPVNNIQIHGLNLEGEMQTSSVFYGCGPRGFNIGNYNNNLEIANSTFNHMPGAGIAAFSAGGTGIVVHHNYFDQDMDSAANINTQGLDFSNNTMVNTPGIESGGGPDLRITHNSFLNGTGFYMIGLGGATGGRPYYGGVIESNNILNPLRNGISIGAGFARGRVCNNLITGMTPWYSQNFGILQAGSGAVPTFGNLICNNKLEGARGSNNPYGGVTVSAYNGPLGDLQGSILMGNTAEGFFVPGGISGTGTVIGIGNVWNGDGINGHYDFSLSSGNTTYIAQGDTLMHGSYSAHNVPNGPGAVFGSFINGTTGQPMNVGAQYQQQGDFSADTPLNYLTQSGLLQGYGLSSLQVTPPTAPGVTVVGTAGSTTYTYYCTALSGNGIETTAGTANSTATGNATLSTTNYNTVTCPFTLGAATMNVYRTAGGATQGRIATGLTNLNTNTTSMAVNDTGLAGTGSFAPASNLTGGLKLGSTYYAPATICKSDGTNCPAAPVLVASGSLALATNSIAAAPGCQAITAGSVNSATATGATVATDALMYSSTTSLSAVTGYIASTSGGLSINGYITAGFVNFDVCNNGASAIIPGAVTLNWKVYR